MLTRLVVAALALVMIGTAAWFLWPRPRPADRDAMGDVALGAAVYRDHCASCHGANLEGQPDWMARKPDGRLPAPPHDATGHTWHHADEQLFQMTKKGMAPPLATER